ncbi:AAA family ATPase [Candidatus Micrarchaeota archaeon]|nr:AAA family ATPase [Candidatus Micrarchaeota archaeon]MBU1930319.1 AAA family ATPase [Candidatus Micrarchaeota archaeon]
MTLRTKTGIAGLDKALQGGFPEGNMVLVSGGAGTGKSTLCLQFLVNGCKEGDRGVYVSTEQNEAELSKQAASFGWDLQSLIKKNQLKIVFYDITGSDNFLKHLEMVVQEFKPKRIVIDSMTTLTDSMILGGITEHDAFSMVQIAESVSPIPRTEQIISKQILYQLLKALRKYKVTTLLTSELYEEVLRLSADGISEFISDGVLLLSYLGVGQSVFRSIRVRKMRYTDHEKGSLVYQMTAKGIEIKPQELSL